MANVSVEQALRSQVKFDIGDDEDITFKQKNQLNLKYGLTPVVITEDDKFWLEWEEYHDGI
jgi:hypothetical protein